MVKRRTLTVKRSNCQIFIVHSLPSPLQLSCASFEHFCDNMAPPTSVKVLTSVRGEEAVQLPLQRDEGRVGRNGFSTPLDVLPDL